MFINAENVAKLEGEITNIIKRDKSEYVGVIQIHHKKEFCICSC